MSGSVNLDCSCISYGELLISYLTKGKKYLCQFIDYVVVLLCLLLKFSPFYFIYFFILSEKVYFNLIKNYDKTRRRHLQRRSTNDTHKNNNNNNNRNMLSNAGQTILIALSLLLIFSITTTSCRNLPSSFTSMNNDECQVFKYNRTLIVDGCQAITVPSAMCFGLCPSEEVTSFINMKSVRTRTCSFCKPEETKKTEYELVCPGRRRPKKKTVISVIKCQCQRPKSCT